MRLALGSLIAAIVYMILFFLWTPKVYTKIDPATRSVRWTETMITRIWKDPTDRFLLFEVPGSKVIVAREELADFRNAASARGHIPRQKPESTPVTERWYVFSGYNVTVLVGYLLFSAAIGAAAGSVAGGGRDV